MRWLVCDVVPAQILLCVDRRCSKLTGTALERDLKEAQQAAERPANQPTTLQHRTEVEHIEQVYTQTAKLLKEEEAAVARKELELSRWKTDREEVAKMTVGDEDGWADGKV